jgi:hypothetical protein
MRGEHPLSSLRAKSVVFARATLPFLKQTVLSLEDEATAEL